MNCNVWCDTCKCVYLNMIMAIRKMDYSHSICYVVLLPQYLLLLHRSSGEEIQT